MGKPAMPTEAVRRLIVVSHGVDYSGGQEAVTARIVEHCLNNGWNVDLVVQRTSIPLRPGLRVFRVPLPKRPAALTFPLFWILSIPLVWSLRRQGATVLASGPITGARVDVTSAHFCHKQYALVATESRATKSNWFYRLNGRLDLKFHLAAERRLYASNRTTVCAAVSRGVSDDVQSSYPHWAGENVVISNGVPASSAPVEHSVKQILTVAFVGGDWPRKGLGLAIEALAKTDRWNLLVAGEGDRVRYASIAEERGVLDRVEFLGQVANVGEVHHRSDAYLLASSYEAFPLAALEAASAGLPLVATRVNGITELFEGADVGVLVERTADGISQGLASLQQVETRIDKGAQAKAAVSELSWERQLEKYTELFVRVQEEFDRR